MMNTVNFESSMKEQERRQRIREMSCEFDPTSDSDDIWIATMEGLAHGVLAFGRAAIASGGQPFALTPRSHGLGAAALRPALWDCLEGTTERVVAFPDADAASASRSAATRSNKGDTP